MGIFKKNEIKETKEIESVSFENIAGNLKVFENSEFGQLKVLIVDGKEYFPATECAKILGYSDTDQAIRKNCRYPSRRRVPHPQSKDKTIEKNFIPESDLYRLIIKSKLPSAERFEKWVMEEVLPTIRKTGGFVADDDYFLSIYLPNADEPTKMMFKLQCDMIRSLNERIEHDIPLVEFANHVGNTDQLITMAQMAKIARKENIDIGQKRLFQWLRDQKYLQHDNIPYQRFLDQGIFEVKEKHRETDYGPRVYFQTFVTGKGQLYIIKKLREGYSSVA